jgi:hypothetical protein
VLNNHRHHCKELSLCPNNISHHAKGRNGTETITGDRNIVAGIISPLAHKKATISTKKNLKSQNGC